MYIHTTRYDTIRTTGLTQDMGMNGIVFDTTIMCAIELICPPASRATFVLAHVGSALSPFLLCLDWLLSTGLDAESTKIKYLKARKLLSGKVFLHFGHSHSCGFCSGCFSFCLCSPFGLPSLQHAKVPTLPPLHRPLHHSSPLGTRYQGSNTRSLRITGPRSLRPCL